MNIIENFSIEEKFVINLVKNECIKQGVKVYIVGGAVRDGLLGKKVNDIDICVTTNPINIINNMKYIKKYKYHENFQTSTIIFNNGITIDLIRCRKECYDFDGALPNVIPSDIYADLYRRDFTINAVAYDLIDKKIIDFFNGVEDIKLKRIRKVHGNSYCEDPTRIFRGVRYAVRYEFNLYDKSEIEDTVFNGMIHRISEDRIMREIYLMCMEEEWIKNITYCNELKIMNTEDKLLGKKNQFCDYYYINNRILNLFLALNDEQFIKIFINNSVLEKQLRKSLKDYIDSKAVVESILVNTVSNFEIYRVFKNFSLDEIKMFSFNKLFKYKIINYLKNMKGTVLAVNGHDLFSLGIQQGEDVGKIINYLKQIKIDTLLSIEKYYLKRNLGEILNGIEHKN
ncbi:CCA tRNA nucleotidyltransferase [Clostridium sp. ZS2-4]|uniref:CCA tRNA nucleotidyltransferase n=1 Tax=Clostridium sp. ZS2-4 TaxID=2987703 RepID=UPI00227A3F2C|nr:CCA tRNA nucleotidyltransferase [Clostridium sp. ZS2-4]MCY6354093.1 CCA tRNA nucleotidyltransferase [Clostridium sp. ZS2-4]